MGLAASLCDGLGLELPVLDAVSTSWSSARDALGHTTDFTAFVRAVEMLNNTGTS